MRNKCTNFGNWTCLSVFWRKIRTTVLLLFLAMSTVLASESYPQLTKLTVILNDRSIEDVLQVIEDQSEFRFFYSESVDLNKRVNIDIQDQKVFDVLKEALRETDIKYEVIGRQVALYNDANKDEVITMMQQAKMVKGTVKSSEGEALPGVSVSVQGTTVGTITELDGNYSIEVPNQGTMLVFSFIGMETQAVEIGSQTTINVVMTTSNVGLDEVVVVGYGVQKRSDVTGAITSVSDKDINSHPVTNVLEALQGKAAGVNITTNERPGEVGEIYIRGMRSLAKNDDGDYIGNTPLYVIDGIPMQNSSMTMLNPHDIESVDILKDASATAIYGSRGANGVVLVTTKRGKDGKLSLNYDYSVSFETVHDYSEMMNASDYIDWRRWGWYYSDIENHPRGDAPDVASDRAIFTNYGVDEYAWANILKGWGMTYDQYVNDEYSTAWDGSKVLSTDWTEYSDRVGVTHDHTISASGGTDKMKSYVSLGYLNQDGTQLGQAYSRYTIRTSVDITPVDWFSMGGSINGRYSDQQYGVYNTHGIASSIPNSVHNKARNIFTYALPYDDDGIRILYPGGDSTIPTIIGEEDLSQDQRLVSEMAGSFYSEFDFGKMFKPLAGLKFRTNFGPEFRYLNNYSYLDIESVNRVSQGQDYVSSSAYKHLAWTLDNLVYYTKDIGKHSIGATLLQSASYSMSTRMYSMSGTGVSLGMDQQWWGLDPSTVTTLNNPDYNTLSEGSLTSYMGRINYSFADKYLLTASYRMDGASQLAPDHKWASFPSLALAWRLDQEEFMQGQSTFDQLKLRLGYGVTGNAAVDRYSTKGSITTETLDFGGEGESYYYPSTDLANPALSWERTTQYNLGVDFSILRGRISGSLDVFKSYTNDLLMKVSLPSVSGFTSGYANVGKTENSGIELSIHTQNIKTKDFIWATSFNMAYVKDEIVLLANGTEDDISNLWFIGQPIRVNYGYESAGLWHEEDAEEMAKFNENKHEFSAGMARPVDQNGDYIIDGNNDKVVLGNERPLWNGGMTNTFTYKNFELSIYMFGAFDYMVETSYYQGGREPQVKIDYYTENNKDAEFQKPIWNTAGGDTYSGILGRTDGSFIKVRNISLGYNAPAKFCNKIGLSNVKVFAQAKNPFSIYRGAWWMDGDTGVSTYNKGYSFGINIGF